MIERFHYFVRPLTRNSLNELLKAIEETLNTWAYSGYVLDNISYHVDTQRNPYAIITVRREKK